MKLEHILLATDLSPEALQAFAPVGRLAHLDEAKITLLHVVHVLTNTGDANLGTPIGLPDYDRDRTSAEEVLQKQAQDLPPEWDVSIRVAMGTRVAETITKEAHELGADVIAITTHGRSGVRRFLLGSVAETVLRHAHVPVLCLPPRQISKELDSMESGNIRHILIPTDLSDEALRAFAPAFELASSLGAKVTVLHVIPQLVVIPHGAPLAPPLVPPDTSEQVTEARSSLKGQCSVFGNGIDLVQDVIPHENAATGIVEFAGANDVDLIAISTHGRTGFRRLALGSVAEEVMRKSPVPVFGFHRPEE